MADDDIGNGGLDYDDDDMLEDEFDGLGDIDGEEAAAFADKAAFKKLYNSHPECALDYVEDVIKDVPLKVAPPRRLSALDKASMALATKKDSEETTTTESNIDKKHTTYPYLNKYEYTRIIGFRANQLSQGAKPFVIVPEHVSDVREIARMELAEKRLPYIIKRPLPNGSYEYWRLQDLLII